MARIGINTGATANDGTGDNLRAGAGIVNDNFLEIYNYLGAGSTTELATPLWRSVSAGINTLSKVGVGTTAPTSQLTVSGDAIISGVTTLNSSSGVGTVTVGYGNTALFVDGEARIIGVLTVGRGSITFDGNNNNITVGSGITITGSTGIIEATSLVVDGTTLTGASVTSITAGSGISVDQSTGNVTITATGGGSIAGIDTTGTSTFTNINATGIITAASAVQVGAGISVVGVSTFTSGVTFDSGVTVNADMTFDGAGNNLRLNDNSVLEFGDGNDLNIFHNSSLSVIRDQGTGGLQIDSDNEIKLAKNGTGNDSMAVFTVDGSAELYFDGSKKFETDNHGAVVTGVLTATSFSGDGSALTGVGAASTDNILTNAISVSGVTTTTTIIVGSAITANALGVNVTGVSTFSGGTTRFNDTVRFNLDSDYIQIDRQNDKMTFMDDLTLAFGNGDDFTIVHNGNDTRLNNKAGGLIIRNNTLTGVTSIQANDVGGVANIRTIADFTQDHEVRVAGIVTGLSAGIATYFGDTSKSTHGKYLLINDGFTNFNITGTGITAGTTSDPKLYLARGHMYEFINNSSSSHPLVIRFSDGGANYTAGATNNDGSAHSGTVLRFEVPLNAPNTLYYQCSNHAGMGNTIVVYPDLHT